MEQRRFGRTGLDVPVIGMGTWQTFDVRGAETEARQAVTDAALETGASFFDSSPMYGEAERVLGRTLQGRREQALVATKLWTADDREAEQQARAALRYFGGRVDVYQVHNLAAWPRRLDQLERLRSENKVRVIGLTHYAASAFTELRRAMEDPRVGAIQVPYNPRDRTVEAEILPAAAELGLGVIVMRPLGRPSDAPPGPTGRAHAAEAFWCINMGAGAVEVDPERSTMSRSDTGDVQPAPYARLRRCG